MMQFFWSRLEARSSGEGRRLVLLAFLAMLMILNIEIDIRNNAYGI